MLSAVRTIYRESKKPRDNFWTEWCSRPPAALVVWMLRPTPITPNQVTFLSVAVFAGAVAVMVAWRTWLGLGVAAALVQASYILDCADGQLARLKKLASPVGALLDFLMDEVKAFLLVGGAAVRMWAVTGDVRWLLAGVGGLVVIASGIALTTFMRRPEYIAAVGGGRTQAQIGASEPGTGTGTGTGTIASPVALVEWLGRQVIQYPQHLWIFCVFNRLDIFLCVYLGANLMYLGRSSLVVLVKLGRPAK
jgi:phosphatidylglycerophosphate synthase